MPFSGQSYSEIASGADAVKDLIAENMRRLAAIYNEASAIASSQTALGQEWGPIVAKVDALVATDPNNRGYLDLQAHIHNLVADFDTVSARAAALDAQLNT